jgi:hypothetical protein
MLVLKRWHTISEWRAADAIVRPESGWDPCEHYPSTHDCRYTGSSSCGIPQANPCPLSWRGRLFQTRWAQVRWFVAYVANRYGDPLRALAYRRIHNSY